MPTAQASEPFAGNGTRRASLARHEHETSSQDDLHAMCGFVVIKAADHLLAGEMAAKAGNIATVAHQTVQFVE